MYVIKPYNRMHAVNYAKEWALKRNPLFQDFAECGGDCTNFVSQTIFAGSCIMNDTPTFGWYYRAPGQYAPAWTGVPYFFNFMTTNMEEGPFAEVVDASRAELGDIVQLGRRDGTFYHTLVLTGIQNGGFLVSAHNNDALNRPLSSYIYDQARFLHIKGVRISLPAADCCYEGLMDGTSLFPTDAQRAAFSCYPGFSPNAPEEEMPQENETPSAPPTEEPPQEEAPPIVPEETPAPESPSRPADILPPDMEPPRAPVGDYSGNMM